MRPQQPSSRGGASPRFPRPPLFPHRDCLAIRKEIVLTRIAVERAELIQATHVARERLRNLGWARYLIPGGCAELTNSNSLAHIANIDPTLAGLLERYPLKSVAELALSGLTHTRIGRIIRRTLQWGGLGMLVWRSTKHRRDTMKLSVPQTGSAAKPRASVHAPMLVYHGALPLM